jgi:acyl-CoA synthetase (AMP-forming)/AMP-acid ligase II
MSSLTLRELLSAGSAEAIAITAPERPPLTYGALRGRIGDIVSSLNNAGIGRNDRVAIVLPNGPDMAAAFLGVASGATAAPLNPAYKEEEFAFYLSDLAARALIVETQSTSPAIAAAKSLGIEIISYEALTG